MVSNRCVLVLTGFCQDLAENNTLQKNLTDTTNLWAIKRMNMEDLIPEKNSFHSYNVEARHRPGKAEGDGAGECGAGVADSGGDPPEPRDGQVVAAVRAGVCRQGMGLHNGRSLSNEMVPNIKNR